MKKIMQFGFTSTLIILIAVCLYLARDWNSTTALFPRVVGYPLLVLSVVILVTDIKNSLRTSEYSETEEGNAAFTALNLGMLRYFAWLIGFVTAVWAIGLTYTIPIYIFSYMKIEGKYGWLKCGIYAIAAVVSITLLFRYVFRVAWPEGALLRFLF